MRKLLTRWSVWAVLAAAGALAVAGVAVAKHVAASTTAVSATFSATAVKQSTVRTCTGSDGTYELTDATYTGTASSADARLNGTLELRVKSAYNTTEGLGQLSADVKVRAADGRRLAEGKLRAVNQAGQLHGLLDGRVHDPNGKLLGNVTAVFSSGGGFSSGQIGTGTAASTAVVFDGGCDRPHPAKPDKPKKHR
jgi:hypothetical protein